MAAETLWRSNRRRRSGTLFDIKLVAANNLPVMTQSGVVLSPNAKLDDINDTNIIFVPALWRNPFPIIKKNSILLNWLSAKHQQHSVLAGVSTGCFFFAEAGLLKNRAATTHWHYFDEFNKRYPDVILKRQHFITEAESIYCTGSVNSLADLTIYFIQRLLGKEIATAVERHFFHEIRHAYSGTNYFEERLKGHPDETVTQIQHWMQEHYTEEVKLQELAAMFDLSLRSFNRRFKNAIGKSPLHYLQEIRMESAKDLLQSSNLSVAEITENIGYSDSAHFSKLFRRHHNVSPQQYRLTVRSKLFS